MATIENLHTGNGSTTNYSFTFEYLKQADVKVTLDGTATTAYTFANATPLSFTTAPANNVAIRIYRDTDVDTLKATFFPGSAIKAEDLNDNFKQTLFSGQESDNIATSAETAAATATSSALTANTTAQSALTAVNTYLHDGTNPVGDGVGSNPQGLAYAINTANSATTTANSATATANTASATASSAVTTASSAVATANAAQSAVASAAFYSPYAALANLPASPSNLDRAEVADSTNVQTNSSVSGVPTGFVGSPGLTVRLQYSSSLSKWEWQNYFANDSENRYLTKSAPVVFGDSTNGSGQITLNCENNSHGVVLKGPPHSAAATYTLTFPNNTGSNGQYLTTNGSGSLSWTSVNLLGPLTGNLDLGSNKITNLVNPTAAQDAATKTFVERKAVAMALIFS